MMTDAGKKLTLAALMASMIGVVLSALLVCKHGFPELCQAAMGCTIDGVDGCSELGKSKYSKFPLIPIPIAYGGLFFYSWLSLLFLQLFRNSSKALLSFLAFLSIFALVFDLFLFYINYRVLIVPCMLCTATYFVTLVVAALVFMLRAKEKPAGQFGAGLTQSILPAIFAGGVTGAFLLGFFVAGRATLSANPAGAGSLLAPARVNTMLQGLRALKKVELSTRNMAIVEGPEKAYIEIHKFADFRCPHCRHAAELIEKALRRWPGRIRVYYRHFPLDGSCNPEVSRKQPGSYSCNGAQASLCAPEADRAKFYHGLFAFQDAGRELSIDNIKELAAKEGLGWSRISACMGTAATARIIRRDVEDAVSLNIESTPTIVLDNRLLPPGTPDPEYFLELMDALVFEKEGQAAFDEFAKRHARAGN